MHNSLFTMILNKMYYIFKVSYKQAYVFPFIISCIIFAIYNYNEPENVVDYIGVLNAIGILSTFYLFGMEKIDLVGLLKTMKKDLPAKRSGKKYTEGVALVETYFALLIIQVLLLVLQYILIIFRIEYMLLLIMSIIYMMMAFLFSISCWHGFTFLHK